MSLLGALLVLLNIEGLAALLWAFLTPSETGQAAFLWLSRERIALVFVLLAVLVCVLAATLRILRARDVSEHLFRRLDAWSLEERWLVPTLIALVVVPALLTAGALAVLRTPLDYKAYRLLAPETFPLLHSVVRAVLPLLVLIVIAMLEAAIFLVVRYRAFLRTAEAWAWSRIGGGLLWLLIALVTLFQWIVLAFQLRVFVNIPAWYWIFEPVRFFIDDLAYILGVLVLLGLAYWLMLIKKRIALGLITIVALSCFLQLGVGLMGGGGVRTLRLRYFTTYHAAYVEKASHSQIGILEGIRSYEQIYGADTFTGTKAPGLMAFYSLLERLVNGDPAAHDGTTRFARFSAAVMIIFPILAALTAVFLWWITRRFLDDPSGLVQRSAPLLYVFAPNVVLLSFFADQALYPLAFLLGACLCVLTIRRQHIALTLLLGCLLYGAIFFSFTMIPLFAFAAAFIFLHYWQQRSQGGLQRIIWHALALAAGTLLMHFLFMAVLNYDFIARLQRGMDIHHTIDFYLRVGKKPPTGPEPIGVRAAQIFRAAWFNNLDLAAAIGFPIYILFFVQAVRRGLQFLRGTFTRGDAVSLALLAAFVGINVAGSEQGEVPRLWLFWTPMIALFAAYELQPLLQVRPRALLAICLMQLVTIMLTFHFQDLRM